jgi:beta-glucosidase
VVIGEKPYAEFLGDVPTLDYQPEGATDLAMIRKLKAAGIPVVTLFLSGRPLFTSPEINASDAFVAAWLPGTQGAGVADVLVARRGGTTKRDFTGRLPFAWPADARSPVSKPLFERGYGLSYAKPGSVGTLSEDPGVDVAATVDTNRLIAAGRAAGPWSLTLADQAGGAIVSAATATSLGGRVAMKPVDVSAQEDGRLFTWTGPAAVVINGKPADFTRQLNNAFALRLDLVPQAVGNGPVKISFGSATFNLADVLRRLPAGKLATVKVPLRCFADAGAAVTAVDTPLKIEADAGTAFAVRSATIEAVGEPLDCPPR